MFRKKQVVVTSFIIGFLLFFSDTKAQKKTDWKPVKKNEIVGTWKLVSYKEPKDSVFRTKSGADESIKLNTATHYSFAYYNKAEPKFEMAGGGTYTYSNGIYTEKMDFFSLRPSLAGRSFSFTLMIKGDSLYQKSTQPNGLEEYWIRLK